MLLSVLILSAGIVVYVVTHSFFAVGVAVSLAFGAAAIRVGLKVAIGVFLLLMPLQWLVIAAIQFYGVKQYQLISGIKELVFATAVLWFFSRSSHRRVLIPDILIMLILCYVSFLQIFHPDFLGMRDDWEWTLLYALGRLISIKPGQDTIWARSAVWMCAALAIMGGLEVEVLGPGPRLLLQTAQGRDRILASSFFGQGYHGLRAASTMVSPLSFSALCMVSLVLWWAYMKNPVPAMLIGAGLALTLTRSAVAATMVACLVIGFRRREKGRIAFFTGAAVLGILIAIFTLNLGTFLTNTFVDRNDFSAEGHVVSIQTGFKMALENPFGTGAGTIGPRQVQVNRNTPNIEDTFLTIAVQYGIVIGLLFISFYASCLVLILKVREPLGYAAFSILIGFGLLLFVGPIHMDVSLGCWVWVPVGMAVTRASQIDKVGAPQIAPSRSLAAQRI